MLSSRHISKQYHDFTADASGLVKEAAVLAETLNLGLDLNTDNNDNTSLRLKEEPSNTNAGEPEVEGNERLLRHYVSLNVVDRPTRQGRDAIYGARHLYQYLTARRLLKQGFGLAKIGEFTRVTTDVLLDALLAPPHRSEAELLVAAFKAGSSPMQRPSTKPYGGGPSAKGASAASIDPIYGMADLLKEIEQMRYRFSKELDDMRRVSRSLDELNRTIYESQRLGLAAQTDFMDSVGGLKDSAERTRYEMNRGMRDLQHRMDDLFQQMESFGQSQRAVVERLEQHEDLCRTTLKALEHQIMRISKSL
jgi:hypothetical protein